MAKTRAQQNREIRQEELRKQLAEQCRVQHVLDTIKKIEELDEESESFSNALSKLKAANDQRLKLISKYLPDLKQQEITMEAEHTFAQISDEISTDEWESKFK